MNIAIYTFISLTQSGKTKYSKFANVRFDLKVPDAIEYHDNGKDVLTSIEQHLPNATLGYSDPYTGSDVLSILELFLDNSQVPVCGSQLLILVKRYPNSQDISSIVAKLRQHHAYVFFIVSNNPSGGSSPETLYNIATRTNGFCGFQDEEKFSESAALGPSGMYPNLIYATNVRVSGKGSTILPPYVAKNVPITDIMLTLQDHGKLGMVYWVLRKWTMCAPLPTGATLLIMCAISLPLTAREREIAHIMRRVAPVGNVTHIVHVLNAQYVESMLDFSGPLSSFQRFKLSWNNIDSDDSGNLDNSKSDVEKLYGNSTFYDPDALLFLDPVIYNITFEYEYSDTKSQVLQIRFYSHYTSDYWIPYND